MIALLPSAAIREAPAGLAVRGVDSAGLFFELGQAARLAASLGGDVLVNLDESAPWRSMVPVVVCAHSMGRIQSSRWGRALRRASLAGASAVLLAEDVPDRPDLPHRQRVPPIVSPAFHSVSSEARPDGTDRPFALAWAEDDTGWRRLLAAWTWVDASLGDSVTLVLLVPRATHVDLVRGEARRLGIDASVEARTPDDEQVLSDLYRRASAVLQAGGSSTAQVYRWALASGAPLAAESTPEAASIVGPAGYLVEPADTRALGAAALTLLVEESVHQRLRELGLQRAAAYDIGIAMSRRMEILRSVAGRRT
jgi:glycosyltransferase involved in cell wall biosynthesis